MYTNRLRKKRLAVLIALALTVALCAAYVPPGGNEINAAEKVDVKWGGNPAFNSYYTNVPGLPDIFAKHEKSVNLYYMVKNYDAVYCIERERDTADPHLTDDPAPNITLTADQKAKLGYLLKHGARKFEVGNLESNKLQVATQLAIWILLEDFENDDRVKDLVLYKATGSVKAGDAFAPTPEIGRMARKLLEDAKGRVTRPIPSFLSETEAGAQVRQVYKDEIYIDDENKVLGLDWNGSILTVKDDDKRSISVDKDTMRIYGLADDTTHTFVFNYFGEGEVMFMTPATPSPEPMQKMVRYIKSEDKARVLYLKVRYIKSGTPPVTTPPPIKPPVTTPPPIKPPVTTPPPIEPPVTTPPSITTPPPINPPVTTRPSITTPPPIDPPVTTRPSITTPPPVKPPSGGTSPPGSGTGEVPKPPPTPSKPADPPKSPPAKPADPPKPSEPVKPADPPKPTEVPRPPEPLTPIADDGTPLGNWTWNEGDKEWVFVPKGKLPQTGAVLETKDMRILPDMPYGDIGAGALAAASLGLLFYLRRMRERD